MELVDRLRAELRHHRSVLAVSPTGSGKTALAAYMIGRAAERGKRVWMTVHRDFLLTQTASALDAAGVGYGFISANREYNPYQRVQIVSIDTAARRLHKLVPPDFLIVDECHHLPAKTWRKVFDWAGNARCVGLSASPSRLDGKGLGTLFSALVTGPSVAWLIERGFLSRYRAYAPSSPDLGHVHSRAGDYVTSELAGVMDTGQIVGNIVGQYKQRAMGKRAIYYAVSVEHSQHIAAAFEANGVRARHLDGASTVGERVDAARALSDGEISVLSNVELFGEGFDLAALAQGATIECVGLCRPTQSLTLHLQQIGRALRPKPEPAIILDHAGNLMRHGLPDDEREWSLDDKARGKKPVDNGAPVRMCEKCYAVFAASGRICPYCGQEAGWHPREVEEVAADLVEANAELLKAAKHREVQNARTLEDLQRLGDQRGYKPGWAIHRWQARQARGNRSADRTPADLRSALTASLALDV